MNLGVIGLGYVGLPIAVAFSKKYNVIGFDINKDKIEKYKESIDCNNEIESEVLEQCNIEFTYDENDLKNLDFIIIAVPTPVSLDNSPDFYPLESASKIVGRNMKKGTIVVYESTVYPGATEEKCIPILEKYSNLICGKDFKVGYSPERINPGDKIHRLENIVKIVSAIDEESLNIVESVYSNIIDAGVFRVSSIKVAEASKIIENTQRDVNIAFMNESAIFLKKLGIETGEVLKAANTKWNFLDFKPGLVGGHCIGVDPYYLISKGESINCNMELVKTAREINDSMPKYIVRDILNQLNKINISSLEEVKIAVLGATFKENVPDIRNSKVLEIVDLLQEHNINTVISDPYIQEDLKCKNLLLKDIKDVDIVVIAVAHNEFKNIKVEQIKAMYRKNRNILYDLKDIISKDETERVGIKRISL